MNFSVALNVMLIVLLVRSKDIHNARNILLLNLACSDLLGAVTIPFTALDALWQHWPIIANSLLVCR